INVDNNHKDNLKKRLLKLLKITDNNCMISNAIKNNVEVRIEPTLV
ncbi:peroxiredoxin, partial [Staphylococcus aureus]